jgi:hypothetical protein
MRILMRKFFDSGLTGGLKYRKLVGDSMRSLDRPVPDRGRYFTHKSSVP